MPYISPARRKALKAWDHPRNVGEMTYAVTMILVGYTKYRGLSFQTINDVRGVLTSALDEFNRRIAHKYEDEKLAEHGDVYEDAIKAPRQHVNN